MCGIAGLVSIDGRKTPDRRVVASMLAEIRHRGPDDEGLFEDSGICFGHARLSIQDLTPAAHQPMLGLDGSVLVYNGEIYNHPEIRSQLPEHPPFQSTGDTETLLRALTRWGLDTLPKLNGMFSFAWWASRRRTLYLVRDRLGVKPLYWTIAEGWLIFCSELRGILATGLVPYEPDPQAVADYLALRFVPAPATAVKGIFKLPAGHWLSLHRGNIRVQAWWRLPVAPMHAGAPPHYQTRFEELFDDAVRLRLRADVPVGVFLSGGLDSSAVAAVARRYQPIASYAVAFDMGGFYDERFYARLVAERLQTDHHETVVSSHEFKMTLPAAVRQLDEPITDMAALPLYLLARRTARDLKVVLSGEGSDEVLGGYNFNRIALKLAALDALQMVPKGLRDYLAAVAAPALRRWLLRLSCPSDRYPAMQALHITSVFTDANTRELLAPVGRLLPARRHIDAQYAAVAHADPLNQMMAVYAGFWLAEDLLMKADKMTMAHGLELRVPFLDYRLVEFLFLLPGTTKVSGPHTTGTKKLLRKAMQRTLPHPVLTRDKRGFPVPLAELAKRDAPWLLDILKKPTGIAALFEPTALERWIARHIRKENVWPQIWNLACLWLWDRQMRELTHSALNTRKVAA